MRPFCNATWTPHMRCILGRASGPTHLLHTIVHQGVRIAQIQAGTSNACSASAAFVTGISRLPRAGVCRARPRAGHSARRPARCPALLQRLWESHHLPHRLQHAPLRCACPRARAGSHAKLPHAALCRRRVQRRRQRAPALPQALRRRPASALRPQAAARLLLMHRCPAASQRHMRAPTQAPALQQLKVPLLPHRRAQQARHPPARSATHAPRRAPPRRQRAPPAAAAAVAARRWQSPAPWARAAARPARRPAARAAPPARALVEICMRTQTLARARERSSRAKPR